MTLIRNIEALSISHKNTPVDIRGRVAFNNDEAGEFIIEAMKNGAEQCAVLSTCCRTEIYFIGKGYDAQSALEQWGGFSEGELSPYIMKFIGKNTINHLYRVACGIESMALGEDEILSQTKNAYQIAQAFNAVDYELNTLFLGAIACAKKIKTDTALSKSSVSTATLAANEAARFGGNVMLIGATGKIGSLVLKNLVSHKNINVMATIRTHGADFSELKNHEKIRAIKYSERYGYVNECSCVISATTSPHYTINAKNIGQITGEKPKLFIDLAVPADIEPKAAEICGAKLIGIDHFEKLARKNNELKLGSVKTAEEIIEQSVDELIKNHELRSFLPSLGTISEKVNDEGFDKLMFCLRDNLTANELAAVLKAIKYFGGEIQ